MIVIVIYFLFVNSINIYHYLQDLSITRTDNFCFKIFFSFEIE